MTTQPTVTDATLQLLLRVNHLLAVADEVRALRDRLMISAGSTTAPDQGRDALPKGGSHASR